MMKYMAIVVLAKCYTRKGFCLAGRELFLERDQQCLGGWVRLASTNKWSNNAFTALNYQDSDYQGLNVLDVILVAVAENQSEPSMLDYLWVNERVRWVIKGRLPACALQVLSEQPATLWDNVGDSTHIFRPAANDESFHVSQSFYIIQPKELHFTLCDQFNPYRQVYQRKIYASFSYNGQCYQHFTVLDPKLKRLFSGQFPQRDGEDKVLTLLKGDNYYLCVSLTPSLGKQQCHYKVVSTVFDYDGYLQRHYG